MKRVLTIVFLLIGFSSFSQVRLLAGYDTTASGIPLPGKKYYDTLRLLRLTSPLYNVDDTTIGLDTSRLSFTVSKNVTGDSIIFLFAGGLRYAVKDSIGSGGSGGMVIGNVVTGASEGSILSIGPGGRLSQNNSLFYYDSANNKIGLGTTTGSSLRAIEVLKTANNAQRISMINNSTGTAAAGFLEAGNGTAAFQVGALGTSYTTSGLNTANTVVFQTNAASKLLFKVIQSAAETPDIIFAKNQGGTDTERWRISWETGSLSNTGADGSAGMHFKAGTASASTAPLKFTSGTNLATPENGAVEFDGTNYFATSGGVRYTLQRVTTVPGSASATGVTGSIAYDSSFIYVCVATNTWVRAALATW